MIHLSKNVAQKEIPTRESPDSTLPVTLTNKLLEPCPRKMPHNLIQNGVRMPHDLNLLCPYFATFQ